MRPINTISPRAMRPPASPSNNARKVIYRTRRSITAGVWGVCAALRVGPNEGATGKPSVVEDSDALSSAMITGVLS